MTLVRLRLVLILRVIVYPWSWLKRIILLRIVLRWSFSDTTSCYFEIWINDIDRISSFQRIILKFSPVFTFLLAREMRPLFNFWLLSLSFEIVFTIVPTFSYNIPWMIIILIIFLIILFWPLSDWIFHAKIIDTFDIIIFIWVVCNHTLMNHFLLDDFVHIFFLFLPILRHCQRWDDLALFCWCSSLESRRVIICVHS